MEVGAPQVIDWPLGIPAVNPSTALPEQVPTRVLVRTWADVTTEETARMSRWQRSTPEQFGKDWALIREGPEKLEGGNTWWLMRTDGVDRASAALSTALLGGIQQALAAHGLKGAPTEVPSPPTRPTSRVSSCAPLPSLTTLVAHRPTGLRLMLWDVEQRRGAAQ